MSEKEWEKREVFLAYFSPLKIRQLLEPSQYQFLFIYIMLVIHILLLAYGFSTAEFISLNNGFISYSKIKFPIVRSVFITFIVV